MAKKKYYLVCRFETKEDFDKHYKSISDPAYERGYEDGMVEAVSYVFEMLDHFSHETQNIAARMNGDRHERIAIENMKRGTMPFVPDDPAMREQRRERNRKMASKKMIQTMLSQALMAKDMEES